MTLGGSRGGSKEKLSIDSDRIGLRGNVGFGLAGHGVVAMFHRVAFSSHKVVLPVKKEANCCWCDSCRSFSIHSSENSCCSSVDSELEGGISPIEQVGSGILIVFGAA